MRQRYTQHFNPSQTPQTQPIPGKHQVQMESGGFAFEANDWTKLRRFLILGNQGGSYYAGEKEMTLKNADAVLRCINEDGKRVVAEILDISVNRRAPKDDPALFALALCACKGKDEVRQAAFGILPDVARMSTQLFHFVAYCNDMRGWGRGLKTAVRRWYRTKKDMDLIYQVTKYPSRDGWSHRDLLRLTHPKFATDGQKLAFAYVGTGWEDKKVKTKAEENVRQGANHGLRVPVDTSVITPAEYLWAVKQVQRTDAFDIPSIMLASKCAIIRRFKLPREVLPTELLNERDIWEALLEDMPATALIRNLANLTRVGILGPMSPENQVVADKLLNAKRMAHPMQYLIAAATYESGHGLRGSNTWTPVPKIVEALNDCFYKSFAEVKPTNKRTLIGIDVSGSMTSGEVAGAPITPRVGAAAMALITMRTEPIWAAVAFTENLYEISLSDRMRLDNVVKETDRFPAGGTNCALPIAYAAQKNIQVEAFILYTDGQSWAGDIHTQQALEIYRHQFGIKAKLVVVQMVSNHYSLGDIQDPDTLNVVGFDAATPQLISDFVRG